MTTESKLAPLIAAVVAGDSGAAAALYDLAAPYGYGLALRILGEQAPAEEVTVKVYSRLWREIAALDAACWQPLDWLLDTVRGEAIRRLRSLRASAPESIHTEGGAG